MKDVAIVVGASGGIGRSITEHLLETDTSLRCAVVDLGSGWSGPLAERFGDERVIERSVDVRDHDAVRRCVDGLAADVGAPTKLVYSAGIQTTRARSSSTIRTGVGCWRSTSTERSLSASRQADTWWRPNTER